MKQSIIKLTGYGFALCVLVFIVLVVAQLGFNYCGLTIEGARERVENHLIENSFDPNNLENPTNPNDSCMYEYSYKSETLDRTYIVLSTFTHGLKLSWVDN